MVEDALDELAVQRANGRGGADAMVRAEEKGEVQLQPGI